MKNTYGAYKGDFKYIHGQRFYLVINNDIAGEFEIVKINPTKNTYTLENINKTSNVKRITVNRFVFELRTAKKGVAEIDIYDWDDTSFIEYTNQEDQGFVR